MKHISKILTGACLSSLLWVNTGCIEETFPTSGATQDQLGASAQATEALMWAMPAFFNNWATISSSYHYDWGYGSIMHIRDVMTEDMAVVYSNSGYDWYESWETNKYQGQDYVYAQFIWNYYYQFIQTSNNLIGAVDETSATEQQLGYLGAALAFRALAYLDLAQMIEFLPNDGTNGVNEAGNDVTNLTVPIVRETTTQDEARNNPRVSREEMAAFILGDLDKAEQYIVNLERSSRTLPDLSVVYGLKARYYMWLGEYASAQNYARQAINAADVTPMTEDQCLNTTSGFNDLSCWMWGSQLRAEDNQVQTGIVNWTSWMSNEATYGYTAVEPHLMINKRTYDRISDTDFRKKLWKAPAGSALEGQTPFIDASWGASLEDYASVKFRPNAGNTLDYLEGSASAFPVMRVEEMYFIEAEAAAHQNAGEGRTLLEDFMRNYRDPQYTCTASDVVDEIVFQKRVELWGEGLTFFDVKRLNMPVTRGYDGTNFHDMARLNTTTRPAWMNISIVRNEKANNPALTGYENPDPTDVYTPWTE